MPNPWGLPEVDGSNGGSKSSINGPGRKAAQTSRGEQVNSHLVIPVDFIGPDIDVRSLVGPDQFTKLQGDKALPSPLMPPEIDMSDEQLKQLALYLERELSLCEGERLPYIKKLARFKFKYRTEFPELAKNWPIANSSQITIPIIKTGVDTITGRLYQTVVAAEPIVRIKTDDEDFAEFVLDYEEFLKIYGEQIIDFEELLDPFITEVTMLGTGVLETTNWRDQKSIGRFDPATGQFHKETVVCHSGPTVFHFPIEDYWQRPTFQDPQKAPWCGKELRLSWGELKQMAFSGEIDPEQLVGIGMWDDKMADRPATVRADERVEKFKPNQQSSYTIYEICLRWDVDGDGLDEEIIVYYHRPSRRILRRKFNNFYGGRRPWTICHYKKIPHRLYGEGVAEMLEHLQEEISTIHNQRIDNATIANLRIILVARVIQGLRPGDRLWSGKVVKVGDVQKDVGTLQLGEIYPSTVQNESIAQSYVREVSGASETAMGQSQPVSRTTATAQMALLEELNRRFDKPLRNIRRCLKGVHAQLSDLFMEQGTGGLAIQWLGKVKGDRVERFLQLPPALLNKKIKLQISSTRSSNNKEVDFQTQIAVMQLVITHGQQMMDLTQMLAPQALGVVAHELLTTIRPIFRKVMAYAEAGDPDKALSILDVLTRILPAPENMGGMAGPQDPNAPAMVAGGGSGGTPGQGGGPVSPPTTQSVAGMVQAPTLSRPPNGASTVPTGQGGGY